MSSYNEELDFVAQQDDSYFPEYLFNPLINDFDEDYYSKGIMNDPISLKAKSIRRKYSNYFDWLDALETYREYKELLIEKYGSWSFVKTNAKLDLLDEVIPPKPKLKNNRRNREYIKSGIIPSRKIKGHYLESDEVVNMAREVYQETGEDVNEFDSFKKPNKEVRKMMRNTMQEMSAKARRDNLFANIGNRNSGTDFIIEWYTQASRGIYNNEESSHKHDNRSIMEIVRDQEELDSIPDDILEYELMKDEPVMHRGILVRKSEIDRIELLKELYAEGFDLIGNNKGNMSRNAVKMLKNEIGPMRSGSMTKKELKRLKKKHKQEEKRLEKQRDADTMLSKILLGNKVNTNENIVDFRLSNFFKSDD